MLPIILITPHLLKVHAMSVGLNIPNLVFVYVDLRLVRVTPHRTKYMLVSIYYNIYTFDAGILQS